jgi:hypothetical protein
MYTKTQLHPEDKSLFDHSLIVQSVHLLPAYSDSINCLLYEPGADPTTSKCTNAAPALYIVGGAFFNVEENIFCFQNALVTRGVVNFYNTAVVTHDRRIGS